MHWQTAISIGINRALCGGPEPFCARAYRRDWRLVCAWIDGAFAVLTGEADHCRVCHDRHRP